MDNLASNHKSHDGRLLVATFYNFTRMNDLEERRTGLRKICLDNGIKGTIILAQEGINGTVCGGHDVVAFLLRYLTQWQGLASMKARFAKTETQIFNRIKIKIKTEIVTMGQNDVAPTDGTGVYVDPKDWNSLLERENITVIDVRNEFEIRVGRFKNSISPQTENFHNFPDWANQFAAKTDPNTKIAMYCTGGIRCEKASSYMQQLGFKQVYQLKGGILQYLNDIDENDSSWIGECFVFDDRVSVTYGLAEGIHKLCYGCREPLSPDDTKSRSYEDGVSCPFCIEQITDAKKDSSRERSRQMKLARLKGKQHLGVPITKSVK